MVLWCYGLLQAEAVYRRAVWENKWRLVRRHNLEAEAGNATFTLGLNQLADMVGRDVMVCGEESGRVWSTSAPPPAKLRIE